MYILASCTIGIEWLHVMHSKWEDALGKRGEEIQMSGLGSASFLFDTRLSPPSTLHDTTFSNQMSLWLRCCH